MYESIAIGAANIDFIARVKRFPQPDEEVEVSELKVSGGGCGANFAVGLARLGHNVAFLGRIGDDQWGDLLIKEFLSEGVDISLMKRVGGRTGSVFAVVNEKGERILYTHGGVSKGFSREDIPPFQILRTKTLYLSSIISEGAIDALKFAAEAAFEKGIKVIFSPGFILVNKGLSPLKKILSNVHILLLSQAEVDHLRKTEKALEIDGILSLGPETVIVTRGKEGAVLWTPQFSKGFGTHPKGKVVDTIGAGDSFAAGLVAGMLEDMSIEKAMEYALLVAYLSVKQEGARSTPTKDEVLRHLKA